MVSTPSSSGPRWARDAIIDRTASVGAGPPRKFNNPAIPHISAYGALGKLQNRNLTPDEIDVSRVYNSSQMLTCSVVIPTRMRAHLLGRVLDSLAGQSVEEIVVVNDGADAGTRDLAARYRSRHEIKWIFLDEREGAARARNVGATAARGDVIVFLDDDTTASPDFIDHHLAWHREASAGERVVVLGKGIESYDVEPQTWIEGFMRDEVERGLRSHEERLLRRGADFESAVWIGLDTSIRRDVFIALGGFDPLLVGSQEDVELGARALGEGVRFVYEPRAVACHHSTKILAEHRVAAAPFIGMSHVYRLRDKGHPPSQMPQLAQLRDGPASLRFSYWLVWTFPTVARAAASISLAIARISKSRYFFRKWLQASFALGYWDGVRAANTSYPELKRMVLRDSH
jgi:GT2 family glycosyltransferase